MTAVSPTGSTAAEVAMDRFVSASSGQDAVASLQSLLDGFRGGENTNHSATGEEAAADPWKSEWIWQHDELPESLVYLLQEQKLKTNQISLGDDEEAVTLVLQLYQRHLAKDPQSLLKPEPSRLLEALLDVMDRATTASTYTRVLALQVLEQLSRHHTSVANRQWLQAPNGLHRLADMLTHDMDNPMEEAVRTQALPVALQLARTSPPMAKVFLFAEVETKLLEMSWKEFGGLTKGNPMVGDILDLILTMVEQASDPSLHELVWQRPSVAPRLAQLLDLRGGDEFLHPEDYVGKKKTSATSDTSSKGQKKTKPKLGPLSSRNMDDEEDDLDTLLQTATTSKSKKSTSGGDADADKSASPQQQQQQQQQDYPRLLESEEKIVSTVLKIVNILLEGEDLRRQVWSDYAPGMCSLIWELALQTPPPSGTQAFLAFPSCQLQQQALELVATKLADPTTMDRHNGLDRLLEKVCTGGGIAESLDQKLGISQAALAVLRSILDSNRIHEILLHTLAPPPMMEESEEGVEKPPPGPTVVQKLWNTVEGHLIVPATNNNDDATATPATPAVSADQRTLFLSGALGGLAVFLVDEESREMLSRATPSAAHLDHMLEVLVESSSTTAEDDEDNLVVWSLYRFLCEYIYQTPRIVQTLLSNSASTHLATLATKSTKKTKPLVYLLLGLCMEFFPTEATECGGWTPTSILELLQTVGISKVTKALEGFKKTDHQLPWTGCELEAKHWSKWYQQAVWVVRKRVVTELAGSSSLEDEDDDDASQLVEGEEPLPSAIGNMTKIKPLQRLISQQTTELEELRLHLEQANVKIDSQEHQLETWQRRLKSTPNELDGMLNELTSKTAILEEQISTLQNGSMHSKEKHQEAVAAMTRQLDEQRDEATKLRLSEQEAQEDRDRMEQELQAVSQAYASLEEEYRRSSSSGATTEGGAPTGEAAASHHQAQGEASTPGGSTEVSTIRAENARLRQDAQAADEWMAMAVQRMNEMGAQVTQLQQENANTKEHAQLSASTPQHEEPLRQEIDRLQHQTTSLQEEVQQEQSNVSSLYQKLQVAEAQTTSLQEKIQQEQSNVSSLHQKLQQAETQKTIDIEAAVAAAQEESRHHLAVDPNQIAEIERLQNDLEAKSLEIRSLQNALEETRLPSDNSNNTTATATPGSDDEIPKQLEAVRGEMEESHRRFELEIYKKESMIRELEDRLGSGLGPYQIDDIRERDQAIEELTAANEAAQEWMSKAVEHHQLLQEKVANLAEEKATITAQQGHATLSTAHQAAVKLLEERADELQCEKGALEASEKDDAVTAKAKLESELMSSLRRLQLEENQGDVLQAKTEEVERLEEELAVERGRQHEAREEIEELTRTLEEKRTESETVVGQWTGT
jgi:hypothetical protein